MVMCPSSQLYDNTHSVCPCLSPSCIIHCRIDSFKPILVGKAEVARPPKTNLSIMLYHSNPLYTNWIRMECVIKYYIISLSPNVPIYCTMRTATLILWLHFNYIYLVEARWTIYVRQKQARILKINVGKQH